MGEDQKKPAPSDVIELFEALKTALVDNSHARASEEEEDVCEHGDHRYPCGCSREGREV